MTKIKTLEVSGLRGIKDRINLDLNGCSILIYGDNGSGKSSISDAIEWFYRDRIEHLTSSEIGRGGIPALRSVLLDDAAEGVVTIKYTKKNMESSKAIQLKKGSLVSSYSNETKTFQDYLNLSSNENLVLRYRDLVPFIIATKKEKLDHLSNIIGFSKVSEIRSMLKKTQNELGKYLKARNFDNEINIQQRHMIEHFGHNITSKKQFLDAINNLIKPLGLSQKLAGLNDDDIQAIEKLISVPENTETIKLLAYYDRVYDAVSNLHGRLSQIKQNYNEYLNKFENLAQDIETISKIILDGLLHEGVTLLKNDAFKEDKCPLCLQPKKLDELLNELESRINELQQAKAAMEELNETRELLEAEIENSKQITTSLLLDGNSQLTSNRQLKTKLGRLDTHFENYLAQLKIEVVTAKKPKSASALAPKTRLLKEIMGFCETKRDELKLVIESDKKLEIYSKMKQTIAAYKQIKQLEKTKQRLENQLRSIECVYSAFVKKQKEGLEEFIDRFSTDINELYQFMNPDENIDEIRLITLEENDELAGITIEADFHNSRVSPPHGYLSESHLNCLGIAFYLASAIAFNRQNHFLVLDDVISSFDSGHRKRFADLINEKFTAYQIILLTHEKDWFDYVANMIKGKNWLIQTVKYDQDNGSHIDENLETLQEKIERRIKEKDCDGLGNNMRRYLERILKQVALNLKIKVEFRFNDTNEDRMCYELLTEAKGKINKHGGQELKYNKSIDRLISSSFIGSKASHDSSFEPTIGDLKSFWEDIRQFESMLYCDKESCKYSSVSLRYYDNIGKTINCGCGNRSYSWNV